MKAKLIIAATLVCGAAVLFTSCNGCSNKQKVKGKPAAEVENVRIQDSLNVVNDAGMVVTDVYEGLIPGADVPGINYELSLVHYDMLDNGVYRLRRTYLDANGKGQNAAFIEYGRYSTFIGIPGDDMARNIRLVPFDDQERTNLVFENSGALTMLSQDRSRIESEHNYTLVKRQ